MSICSTWAFFDRNKAKTNRLQPHRQVSGFNSNWVSNWVISFQKRRNMSICSTWAFFDRNKAKTKRLQPHFSENFLTTPGSCVGRKSHTAEIKQRQTIPVIITITLVTYRQCCRITLVTYRQCCQTFWAPRRGKQLAYLQNLLWWRTILVSV